VRNFSSWDSSNRERACSKLLSRLGPDQRDISMVDSEIINDVFETNPVLGTFESTLQYRISRACAVVNYSAGEAIEVITGGHARFCVVLSGSVQVWVENSRCSLWDGEEEEGAGHNCLGTLTAGDWFGEQALDKSDAVAYVRPAESEPNPSDHAGSRGGFGGSPPDRPRLCPLLLQMHG
jgi:hypothetical protein